MADSVDRVFVHALNTVKRIPRTGSARPPLAERLKLYGLYKQSMEGDVEGVMDRPSDDDPDLQAEREKWDSWYAQRHLSRTEAKRRYINTLVNTMHRYASSTPEARELISELEFVWDQIKSNTTSSSSSSPQHVSGMPVYQHVSSRSQYGSIGDRMSGGEVEDMDRHHGGGRDSRLRVLSPVSQPDDGTGRRGGYDPPLEGDDLEEDDEEDFQEARNSPFEDDDEGDSNNDAPPRGRQPPPPPPHGNAIRESDRDIQNRRWRRRVEQAMTKMTAEVAAMREQMEARTQSNRRRASLWAWIKWLVWTTIRQLCWDAAILGCVLLFLRIKGDRRLENMLRSARFWQKVRKKLEMLRRLRRLPRIPWVP
ncbi:hypothetical protein FQN52_004313 [Onygenales sp. PD_12]|nr:hypothetical protein FQN52_004313 [Onygenales sp. PD_12]